jgi:hypothetical protein
MWEVEARGLEIQSLGYRRICFIKKKKKKKRRGRGLWVILVSEP